MSAGSVTRYRTRGGYRFKARWDQPAAVGRKQASKSGFTSRADATAWLRQVDHEQTNGVAPSALTLAQWLDQWRPAVSDGTAHEYRKVERTWLVPVLGTVRLRDLAHDHTEALTAALTATGRSDKTVRNVLGVLRSALRDAQRRGLVARVAVDTPRTNGRTTFAVWTADELSAFLRWSAERPLYAEWRLMATTGLRRGEACALTWDDLDGTTLHIDRALSYVGTDLVVKEPKTASGRRTITLDERTTAVLQAAHDETSGERMFDVTPQALSARWSRMLTAAPVPRIRLHDLRHTYATLALAQCRTMADVKALSARLGHASVTFTMDRYAKPQAASDAFLADGVAALL